MGARPGGVYHIGTFFLPFEFRPAINCLERKINDTHLAGGFFYCSIINRFPCLRKRELWCTWFFMACLQQSRYGLVRSASQSSVSGGNARSWKLESRLTHFTHYSIWTGVQSWIGGQCVVLLLRSLAPSYNNLPNSMPASSGTTTKDFLGFFLFILMHIPCVWLPVEKVRHFFTVKAIVAPIAGEFITKFTESAREHSS